MQWECGDIGASCTLSDTYHSTNEPVLNKIIIIIIAGMAVFYVAGYLMEERR